MKFTLISVLTFLAVVLLVLYRTPFWHTEPVFIPIPVEQREPFGVDFSLPTLRGETLRLADLRGQVVLVNVWATWCYPCRAEMPAMAALYRRYREDRERAFTILAVSNDRQGREVVAPFVESHKLPFPILLDATNSLGVQLNIPGIPTSYLLDQQGRVVLHEAGQRDWNHPDMHRLLDTLLAASTDS